VAFVAALSSSSAGCNVIFGQTDLEVVGSGGGDAVSSSSAPSTSDASSTSTSTSTPTSSSDASSSDASSSASGDACAGETCSGHGTCDGSSGSAVCTCDARFAGPQCESCAEGYTGDGCVACAEGFQDADDDGTCLPGCSGTPCANDGLCDDSSGERVCTCRPGFGGPDCEVACDAGTAGAECELRIVLGIDLPAADILWVDDGDVPYDVDDLASVDGFDRVAYRLLLDDEEVWVEMDAFTADATRLGVPMDWVFDVAVSNVVVRSLAQNQATIATASPGSLEFWSDCYEEGPDGAFDSDDERTGGTDCYGSMQVHVEGETVLAFNRFAQGEGNYDLGIGVSSGANPDWTFASNSQSFDTRRLEVYVREE
jgi:hypothetical protein